MKYDCSRVLDYVHERNRMCDTIETCSDCPLFKENENCIAQSDINQEVIDIVQKWSDEQPERPRLTKKEYEFLTIFAPCFDGKAIERTAEALYIVFHSTFNDGGDGYSIDSNLFPFISEGEEWYFNKLLGLEVEEC